MAKGSGINYFLNRIDLDTGLLKVFYTFENGAGSTVSSVSGGQSQYAGAIQGGVGTFWGKPGSGLFSGNSVQVTNASGLAAPSFTHLFAFEKINTGNILLFAGLNGASGYNIGLTPTNKLYFETNNEGPIVTASYNNLSSKNLISVGYYLNTVNLGYYNWNAQSFEVESFTMPFGELDTNSWSLGARYTGYMDYYLYFSQYLAPEVLDSIASGLYNVKTGVAYEIETFCSTGITGYQTVTVNQTGVTGYLTLPSGGGPGVGDFTGSFPVQGGTIALTGITSTSIYASGLTGVSCATYTGAAVDLLYTDTGYVAGYGMEKVLSMRYVSGDILKYAVSYTPFVNIYNQSTSTAFSGFNMAEAYTTGQINLFLNGLAQANSGFNVTGFLFLITGSASTDTVFYDLKAGSKIMDSAAPYVIPYSGQEIFFNGLNLISGYDFTVLGNVITLTGQNTGINGDLFEYPIVLAYVTGSVGVRAFQPFMRNTTNLYFNGLRQQNRVDYIEGATYDMLTANRYNENNNVMIYNDTELFWE